MLKSFLTFWRKKKDLPSYEESEKRIISSLYIPMKPTESFKAFLKEQLLDRLEQTEKPMLWKNKLVWAGAVGTCALLIAMGAVIWGGKPGIDNGYVVRASENAVPVNFPIVVEFPYEISQKALDQYFSITPDTEGSATLKKNFLTFTHPKNLLYETEYTLTVSKEADSSMNKDFEISFTTRKRQANPFYLASNIELAHYTLNYYDANPEVMLHMPYEGDYTVNLYQSSPQLFQDYVSKLEKAYSEGSVDKEALAKEVKKEKIETQQLTAKEEEKNPQPTLLYHPGVDEPGVYVVELQGKSNGEYDDGRYQFFITYTRYAISTKRLGTELVSWMVDMQTGSGVPSANVKGIDSKSKTVFTGKTNEQGLHIEEVSEQKYGSYENYPNILLFETNEEQVVNIVKTSFRSIFEVDHRNQTNNPYLGSILFDRPLYKPGDTVKFKTMLRKKEQPQYDGSIQKATVEVTEAYGGSADAIFEQEYAVNGMGTFAGEFNLSKELKTGEYQFKVKTGKLEMVSDTFAVEIFQKPDFEIALSTDQERYISGDSVQVKGSAQYFFGKPVQNQNITIEIEHSYYDTDLIATQMATLDANGTFQTTFENLQTHSYSPGGEPYLIRATLQDETGKSVSKSIAVTFFDSEYAVTWEKPERTWEIRPKEEVQFVFRITESTDPSNESGIKGETLDLNLRRMNWDEGPQEEQIVEGKTLTSDTFGRVYFEHEFEQGGSYEINFSVTDSRGNTTPHSFGFWIPDVKNGIFYDQSSPYAKNQIMLIADKETYRIGETAHISAYFPQEQGDVFLSLNRTNFNTIWTQKISSQEMTFDIPITEKLVPGFLLFAEVYNSDSFLQGTKPIEVEGKQLTVEITPSEQQLYPKEDMTLSILTKDENGNPIASEGAITVIDKAILALRGFRGETLFKSFYQPYGVMENFSTADPFVLGAAEKGGCFLAGTMILMSDGSLKPIEQIQTGDEILTRKNEFSPELVKDKVVRTFEHTVGEYLIVNGSLYVTPIHRLFVNGEWETAGKMEIGDRLIDHRGAPLKVNAIEKVFNRVKVYNFETELTHTYFANGIYVHNQKGGDSRPRTEFLDTAYWNAFVQTDAQGRGEVTFKVPDNLTTWVALGKNITLDTQVGEAKSEFIVNKDLFIRPNLPLFVRTGDQLEIPASIHNTTSSDLKVKALLKATGATVINSTLQELTVKANSSSEITWKASINSGKELKLEFSVSQVDGKLVDNLIQTLPIYPSAPLNRKIFSGSAPNSFEFPFDKTSEFSSATLTLSASAIALFPEVIEKLTGYPYGCVEQTMTKHLPNILVKKHHELLGITPDADLDTQITEGFDRLQKFQHSDGSFGWWENDEASIWMTGYVLEGFIEIKEMGLLAGRENMFDRTLEYLKNALPNLQGNEKIYANYVISRALPGEFPLSIAEGDLEKLEPEFMGYVALTHFYNNNKKEAERIVKEYLLEQMTDDHWEQKDNLVDGHDMSMGDKYLATGVNLTAILTIGGAPESDTREIIQWLMTHRNGYEGLWGSTRQSSQVLFALLKFIQTHEENNPDLNYEVWVNNDKIETGKVQDKRFSKKIELPTAGLDGQNTLQVKTTGKGSLSYSLSVKNYTKTETTSDITLRRTYLKNGEVAKEFVVGDLIDVQIEVSTNQPLEYVLIEDMLPAGFEPINERLRDSEYENEMGYWNFYPIDIRDEHIGLFETVIGPEGSRTFHYKVRVARQGTYTAPGTRLELMYDPETFDVGEAETIVIK